MADKYDKLLSIALVKLKEDEFSYVPEENEIEHAFSEKYLKAIERILNKLDRSYWKYVNTVAKKVAVIIVTLIIAFSSLMTVDAFRETVIDFIVKIYETFSEVKASRSNNSKQIEISYSFESSPHLYFITTTLFTNATNLQVWHNNVTGQDISLKQSPVYTSNYFDSEHGKLSEAIINDTPCLICKDNIQYYCYWEFDGYRFELIYPVDLGEEFMSEVVGNLIEIDPEDMQN